MLDFANTAEDIVEAFEPYYEATTLADVTDPNIVHGTMAKLDAAGIYQESEVNGLVADYLAKRRACRHESGVPVPLVRRIELEHLD